MNNKANDTLSAGANKISNMLALGHIPFEEYSKRMTAVMESDPEHYSKMLTENGKLNVALGLAFKEAEKDYAKDPWSAKGLELIKGRAYIPLGAEQERLYDGDSYGSINSDFTEKGNGTAIISGAVFNDHPDLYVTPAGILSHEGRHAASKVHGNLKFGGVGGEEAANQMMDNFYNYLNNTKFGESPMRPFSKEEYETIAITLNKFRKTPLPIHQRTDDQVADMDMKGLATELIKK